MIFCQELTRKVRFHQDVAACRNTHIMRTRSKFHFITLILLFVSSTVFAQFASRERAWFCKNDEAVQPCDNNDASIDRFNNDKVFPLLQKLLQRDFFKFYKVRCFQAAVEVGQGYKICRSTWRDHALFGQTTECAHQRSAALKVVMTRCRQR